MPYGIARFIGRRQPAIFAALPPTAFLPRKNSTGLFGEGKSDDGKEEDAGILAYAKDDDAVSADLHMGSPQGRKTLWGKEDAPQRGGLPVRVSTTKAEVASDVKACVSLSSEGINSITHIEQNRKNRFGIKERDFFENSAKNNLTSSCGCDNINKLSPTRWTAARTLKIEQHSLEIG